MHFSIPETEELKDDEGSLYTAYKIHVNGVYHCSVRFRQLHQLNEKIKAQLGNSLAAFPPKRLLPLSTSQLEERRCALERYIISLSQDRRKRVIDIFNEFLVGAQRVTRNTPQGDCTLDIHLMNGQKLSVPSHTTAQTHMVLQKVCEELRLPYSLHNFFSLFLMKKEDDGSTTVDRLLQDFEAPCISLRTLSSAYRIVLRKSYWDSCNDVDLIQDPVGLNLLYIQTVADIQHGWVPATTNIQNKLASLQSKGSKKQYLELASTLSLYGYMQFPPCTCDYPGPNTRVTIYAGKRELIFKMDKTEGCFNVKRMRCWRITTLGTDQEMSELELSFEYLFSKDILRWVAVQSRQAMLISLCLQQMVQELLQEKGSQDGGTTNGASHTRRKSCSDSTQETSSVRKLSERMSGKSQRDNSCVENSAFDLIGDDQL